MAESDEDEDKQHEPTQKKLDDARKKGEIAKSADISTAATYAGMLFVLVALGSGSVASFGSILGGVIEQSDRLSLQLFSDGSTPLMGGIMWAVAKSVSPWFLIPGLAALLAVLAQRSFIVAPDKIIPKGSRISILSNAKNKFGRGGLFEFAKSFAKLVIYGIVLWFFLIGRMTRIISTVNSSPSMASATLGQLVIEFLFIVLIISAAIGAVDYLWQKQEHHRRHRMSRKEVTDENKAQEGDPHIKQQRRQKGYAIAMNQMLADVPDADVVIVNPHHYAVALKWDRGSGSAPRCVAKGIDEIAARIREAAQESGVAIHRDPPTARALYATVDVGREILPEHYKAVAAAIRFAETMRQKAKRVWGGNG